VRSIESVVAAGLCHQGRLLDRVRARVFLRMLSCYLSWYLKQALAPTLFHDHDEPAAAAQRRNPVRCGPAF